VGKAGEYGRHYGFGSLDTLDPAWGHHKAHIYWQGDFMKRRLMMMVLCIGIAATAFACGRALLAQSAPRRIELVSKRFAFEPGEITLKKGQPVILVLKSTDVAHGLRFRELNLDVQVAKGGTAELQFTPNKTGDYVGHCSVFCGSGHGEMTLTLHVVD